MVNAASYGAASAPDSLATIFGANLAQGTASATLDAAGQLPTELAGTRVEIAGVAAQLFYVSPTQINLVVPAGIDPGTVVVAVISTASGASKTDTAFLRAAAPGVFSSDGTGTGPGAILNAVTYAPAPFFVQTAANGADTRTRLAVYGTGFRNANRVVAVAQDPLGNRYNLTVEFAGPAPGFFGLDQANLLLPPDLDGAGAVTLSLGADGNPANSVTFQVNLIPSTALQLSALLISPSVVIAGDSAQLTVGLNGVARAGGFPVTLRSTVVSAQVAPQVTIPEGKATVQTQVSTLTTPATVNPTISALAGGLTLTVPLEIDPVSTVQLVSVSASQATIQGGGNLTGTVSLSGNPPAGGANVLLSADSDRVNVPNVVSVPFGKSSADFSIKTFAVAQSLPVTIMATYSRTNVTTQLTLLPALELTLDASSVTAGGSVNATITLGSNAPATGATITFRASDGIVRLPPSITIPPGQVSQVFPITTSSPVALARVVTITAIYVGARSTASLTVNPQVTPALSSLAVGPSPVTSGNIAQGTVTLTAPATAVTVVTLFSNSAIVLVPASVTVPQGQSTATFNVTTVKGLAGSATITATLAGISKSGTLTVQ